MIALVRLAQKSAQGGTWSPAHPDFSGEQDKGWQRYAMRSIA
jgi:hypothetical protein